MLCKWDYSFLWMSSIPWHIIVVVVQSLSCVWLFVTPWTAACQASLMLVMIEGRRRRWWQRMRWLNGITNSMDMSLSKLWEIVKEKGSLAGCSPWGCKESDKIEWLNNNKGERQQETSVSDGGICLHFAKLLSLGRWSGGGALPLSLNCAHLGKAQLWRPSLLPLPQYTKKELEASCKVTENL